MLIKELKVDQGTEALIRNGVRTGQRSIFVVTGDKPHDQIAKLYFILTEKHFNRDRISGKVVWCYDDRLVHPSLKVNTSKQHKSLRNQGVLDLEKGPPFALFAHLLPIKFCQYKDVVQRNPPAAIDTVGMFVLQDFEALTPDLVATSMETLDAGGLLILLIPSSLNARERFPTSGGVSADFLLSLASCRPYIVMHDTNLNILPISTQPQPPREDFTRQMSRLTIHQGDPYIDPYVGPMDTNP